MEIKPLLNPEEYQRLIHRQIGAELRQRRLKLRISAYALAKEAGVTDQTILNIERFNASPHLSTLALICVRFGTTLSEFITTAEQRKR